jgi:fructoselysine and glucoselysine-specific PTS system IIA component
MIFIIATHGSMASGTFDTINFIIGDRRKFFVIDCYKPESKSIEQTIADIVGNSDEKLLVFTDICYGSVNREVMTSLRGKDAYIITDFNLSMILELALMNDDDINEDTIKECIENGKKQVHFFNMKEL